MLFTEQDLVAEMPRLLKWAGIHYGNIDEPEDIVQGTLLLAWRFRESYRGEGPLKQWLLDIMRNHALSELRKQKARKLDVTNQMLDGFEATDPTDQERVLCETDLWKVVCRAVERLPHDQREAIEGWIEGRHNRNDNVQKLRRHRAKIVLRRVLCTRKHTSHSARERS